MKVVKVAIFFLMLSCLAKTYQRPTLDFQLAEVGISTDRENLIRALGDQRDKVRVLAAAKLHEQGDRTAIADIEGAIFREREPKVKVSLALYVGLLGDSLGSKVLSDICNNPQMASMVRLSAVYNTPALKSDSCNQAALQLLEDADSRVQIGVIGYANALPWSPQDRIRAIKAIEMQLAAPVGQVRVEALESLYVLNDVSFRAIAANTIAAEQDPDIRERMKIIAKQPDRKTKQ